MKAVERAGGRPEGGEKGGHRSQGLDFRLTGVEKATVVKSILA